MKGDIFHEELPDGKIRTTTVSGLTNNYWVTDPIDGSQRLITVVVPAKKFDPNDPILREIVEEVIIKSHRQWRSIPETAFLVLKAIEDYK